MALGWEERYVCSMILEVENISTLTDVCLPVSLPAWKDNTSTYPSFRISELSNPLAALTAGLYGIKASVVSRNTGLPPISIMPEC